MKDATQQYRANQILTAPKEDLLLLLLDGAIRFATQARSRMAEKRWDESSALFLRAQRIMTELIASLPQEGLDSVLYANLVGLYTFVYRNLIEANLRRQEGPVENALRILNHLRETWGQAVDQGRKARFPEAPLAETSRQTAPRPSVDLSS